MRLLRSEGAAGEGAIVPVRLQALARRWYGDPLDPAWRPRTAEASQRSSTRSGSPATSGGSPPEGRRRSADRAHGAGGVVRPGHRVAVGAGDRGGSAVGDPRKLRELTALVGQHGGEQPAERAL